MVELMDKNLKQLYIHLLKYDYVVSSVNWTFNGVLRVGTCPGYYARHVGTIDYTFSYLRPPGANKWQ